nr:MAG TPA: hypothetical protein [Microviridae sp.]
MIINVVKDDETYVYSIFLKGWNGSEWSVDLSNDLLTDMDYHDGMEMSLEQLHDYFNWLCSDVQRYNDGGTVEWYERSVDYPENDYEKFYAYLEE